MDTCIPPYTKKENPYSKVDTKYSRITSPYSKLCLTEGVRKLFQDNSYFIFQDNSQYIFNKEVV